MEEIIERLYNFVQATRERANNGIQGPYNYNSILNVKRDMMQLSKMTVKTDMYISKELLKTRDNIFLRNNYINIFALGKLSVLIGALIDKNANKTQNVNNALNLLHPEIIKVSKAKFMDGYYADAVESAFKEINTRMKKIFSQKKPSEKVPDGADLMNRVFSVNNPIIELDDLTNESGVNTQKGYMQMLAGAMTGIRNPKAHANVVITKEEALNSLFFASLLMDKIDKAKR